ncbi:MAG: response regulator [Planctomycetota bacterium]
MRILVVDDSIAMRKIIRTALEGMGYSPASILEATGGLDALQMLREPRLKTDIVLADASMPDVDGLSLLKKLQATEELRSTPFIMMAGDAQRDRVLEAMRAGALGYILKPFTPETLREKVLAVEKELLARKKSKLTDTAVFRFKSAKLPGEPDSELPFLAGLPEELVAAVYESASPSEHGKGDVLVKPAQIVESLHIIDMGEVEILPAGDACPGEVRGRGECFGQLSFLSGDPAASSVRARTDVVVASVGRADFESLLAKHPRLGSHLIRLIARRARRADSRPTSELEKGLSGKLSTVALSEIVQTLHTSRKTGTLRVEGGGFEGEIYFADGDVRHARTGALMNERAFYRLVTWTEGTFTFEVGDRAVECGIFRPTMSLLMEGMCRKDEIKRMRA